MGMKPTSDMQKTLHISNDYKIEKKKKSHPDGTLA